MSMLFRLCRNELEKLWKRRRWVMVGVIALIVGVGLIEAIATRHDETWQQRVQAEVQQLRDLKAQLQKGQGVVIGQGSGQSIDDQIARREYQLSRNIAPADWDPLGRAATVTFVQLAPLLLLVFGWLAAEQVAQERSERTINLLLSRPVSRSQVLAAKGLAVFVTGLAVVLAAAALTFAVTVAAEHRLGSLTSGVLLFGDTSSSPTGVVIPLWGDVAIGGGLAILALLVAQALGLLLSTLSRGPGIAIGVTFGVIAVLPTIANLVGGLTPSNGWLHLFFFSQLSAASRLGSNGLREAGTAALVLVCWSALFYGASILYFRRADELA